MDRISTLMESIPAGWDVSYTHYDPETEAHEECILTMTNGYYGYRGNVELPSVNRLPAVCIAGVYDKPDRSEEGDAFGLTIKNKAQTPAYAIAPLWNMIELYVDGQAVDFMNATVDQYQRSLDMRRGLVMSNYILTDTEGRSTEIGIVSAAMLTKPGLYCMNLEVTAINHRATLSVKFICEQPNLPQYLPRIKDYVSQTELLETVEDEQYVGLNSMVHQTGRAISLRSETRSTDDLKRTTQHMQHGIAEVFAFTPVQGKIYDFTRQCVISHGPDIATLAIISPDWIQDQTKQWEAKWQTADFDFAGDDRTRRGLRWCMFTMHGLGHFTSPEYSISATGLHGPGYFGHVFWDTEIFMLPFYQISRPQAARDFLEYRYRRLDAARQVAVEHGYKGAKFPWTSTTDGHDVCPPDWERCGKRQIHISGDIAYAFENYLQWTGDQEFYDKCGIEIIVETARFFQSRTTEGRDGKLHIYDVIGPDEYNIHADDNTYTNHLAQWNMKKAIETMSGLKQRKPDTYTELATKINWTDEEAQQLLVDAGRIIKPNIVNNVCEQYQGFFDLQDIPEIERDDNHMPVEKLHGYDQGTQVIKQADTLMMMCMFPGAFDQMIEKASFEYYEKRNSFGSSLSPSISCLMGLRLGIDDHAYKLFRLSALLDMENRHMDKSSHEGIHAACAAGTIMAAFFGYGGVSIQNGKLSINPMLPDNWSSMNFHLTHNGKLYTSS